MKHLRSSPSAKIVSFVLAVLFLVGGFWATLLTLFQWDALWSKDGYYSSSSCYNSMNFYENWLSLALELSLREAQDGTLPYLDRQQLEDALAYLSAENTNFRYRVLRNDTGAVVLSNLGQTPIEDVVHQLQRNSRTVTLHSVTVQDYERWNGQDSYLIHVQTMDGEEIFTQSQYQQAAKYGWSLSGNGWDYSPDRDSRLVVVEYALEYGVADPLVVQDHFSQGLESYAEYALFLPLVAVGALVLDILAILALCFLCTCAGHKRGQTGIVLRGLHRMPTDLLVALEIFVICMIFVGGDPIAYHYNQGATTALVVGLILCSCAICSCVTVFFFTCAARIKTRTLLSNTLIGRLLRWIGRGCVSLVAQWPMTWRAVALFLLYLVGTVLTTVTLVLIPLYQGFVLWLICRWVLQWRAVRAGTAHIVGGSPDHRIDTTKMYRDLKEHAEQLNDLGTAISSAVDERMKSERFKAELITNVSHDLKTPLTSIINYVDLLKKEEMPSPRATEYLEVLDRKSQRLKKLTEDLVEASKASTGNLTILQERLGMAQLVRQAVGEFEEKFSQKQLELVSTFPEQELWVEGDGRHLWRILDNLLTNCYKYAMDHTRVYLEVTRWDGNVILSVKNISAQPLNIPPEQLMERFVRGDESRTAEGSGLGLSIARSLTELQGGTFRLSIDGDLFKAAVSFPEASIPVPPQPELTGTSQ